jgi:hypothetical protein
MKLLATITIDGWLTHLKLFYNERYVLITSTEKGMLASVNVEDMEYFIIIFLYFFLNEFNYFFC